MKVNSLSSFVEGRVDGLEVKKENEDAAQQKATKGQHEKLDNSRGVHTSTTTTMTTSTTENDDSDDTETETDEYTSGSKEAR